MNMLSDLKKAEQLSLILDEHDENDRKRLDLFAHGKIKENQSNFEIDNDCLSCSG